MKNQKDDTGLLVFVLILIGLFLMVAYALSQVPNRGTGVAEIVNSAIATSVPSPVNLIGPAPRPTPKPATATARGRVNLRGGPGTNYPILLTLDVGDTATITGKDSARNWWQVVLPSGLNGWLYAPLVDVEGDTDSVPVVPDVPPPPIAPAATATRRSAPAPTATPRPRPTATAQTGPPVYSWDQAPNHIGEYATVCGPIKSATYFSRVDGSPTFINIGRNYPDPARFTALIWGRNRPNFGSAPENRYASGSLCTTGAIELYNGSAQIEVTHPGQLTQ